VPFPLTPTLSLGEREARSPFIEHNRPARFADTLPKFLPLPKGEGRGEGEGHVLLGTALYPSGCRGVFDFPIQYVEP
jgi:hypothetical protein